MSTKIMQWNMGTMFFKYRRLGGASFPFSLFKKRYDQHIRSMINKQRPGIILIQEYLDNLPIPASYKHKVAVDLEHYSMLQTVIVSKKPFQDTFVDKKGAFVAAKIGGVWYVSVHLDTWDSAARLRQAKRIKNFVKNHADPVVVAGDWNEYEIVDGFLFPLDRTIHDMFADALEYETVRTGTHVLGFKFDRLYHSPSIECTHHKTFTDWSQIWTTIDHYATVFRVEKEK